jgi:alkylhydroperoxidase/carboxymuconolactone decarboxylase family protein YurZ
MRRRMEKNNNTLEEVLKMIADRFGEGAKPKDVFSKLIPEIIPKQVPDLTSVMDLPHIPLKYKHLIMIGVAYAVQSELCIERFIKVATGSGINIEEIAESIIVARLALSATLFASAMDGLGDLFSGE